MFLQCPAFMDPGGAVRCGLPAHVQCRYTVASTDGPPEAAKIRCPCGHLVQRPGRIPHLGHAPRCRSRPARGAVSKHTTDLICIWRQHDRARTRH